MENNDLVTWVNNKDHTVDEPHKINISLKDLKPSNDFKNEIFIYCKTANVESAFKDTIPYNSIVVPPDFNYTINLLEFITNSNKFSSTDKIELDPEKIYISGLISLRNKCARIFPISPICNKITPAINHDSNELIFSYQSVINYFALNYKSGCIRKFIFGSTLFSDRYDGFVLHVELKN